MASEQLFEVVRVEPVGTRSAFAHIHHRDPAKHGFGYIDLPTYPEADVKRGEALWRARLAADVGLRRGAALLGIKVVDLSAVEQGGGRFVREEAYAEAVARWRSSDA